MTRSLLALVSAAWLGLASIAGAQTNGGITGTVRDAQGLPIPGVTVTLAGPKTQVAVTDGEGAYRFMPLAPGTYQVRFELTGFRTLERPDIAVTAPGPTTVDVTLEVALMESVTVTAQKREENLQTVPLAITALTSEDVTRARIIEVSDLQFNAPGINVSRAGEDIRPAIRGARTEQVGAVNDPAIGFHVDGIYKSRPSQATQSFVDVDRIEVQRGPQGTLFGRNTFGGNMHIISKAPTPVFDFAADLTLGDYAQRKVNGFVNIPIAKSLQFRFAFDVERRDGYITNTGPAPDLWDNNLDYFRGILRWTPAKSFEVNLRARHWTLDGNGQGDFGYLSLGTVRDPATGYIDLGGLRDPVSPRRGTYGAEIDASPWNLNRDIPFDRKNWEDHGALEAAWTGRFVAVKSLTGLGKFSSYRANDGDYSSNVHAFESTSEAQQTWSQEVDVSSVGSTKVIWVLGAYYLHDEFDYRFIFNRMYLDIPTPPPPPQQPSKPTTIPNPNGLSDNIESLLVRSQAFFGQANIEVYKNLRATVGARYTKDTKTYSNLDAVRGIYTRQDVERSWDKTTYRVGLDYQATPSQLVYGAVSTGFIAGGFAFAAPNLVYNPQNVTAYEVGSKSQFGQRMQLNLSAYYNKFTDLLANQFTVDPVSGATLTYQINAGAVNALGVEAEFQAAPTDALRVGALVALQNAEYGTFILANPIFPLSPINPTSNGYEVVGITNGTMYLNLDGHQVQQSPTARITLNASYDIKTQIGTFTPIVSSYISSSYPAWDIVIGRDGVNVQGAFSRTDLRLEWSTGRQWRVQAFVQNVENSEILLRALRGGDNFIQAVYGAPRTIGVRLGYQFR